MTGTKLNLQVIMLFYMYPSFDLDNNALQFSYPSRLDKSYKET